MRCPYCGEGNTKVTNTNPIEDASVVRRIRLCGTCKRKFVTYERVETIGLMVIKSDGRRESFDREKLIRSVSQACEKLPISKDVIDKVVSEIEYELKDYILEVQSKIIGEKVLGKLLNIHPVAYIRFASVYYKYADLDTFIRELTKLKKSIEEKKNGTGI